MTKAMTTSRDLVCSMDVKVAQSTLCTAHRGFVYHFGSTLCLEQFNDIPALYNGSQHIADIRHIPKRRKLRLADRRLWKFLEPSELESAAHPSTGAFCNRPPARLR